jgi:hypothetical protein
VNETEPFQDSAETPPSRVFLITGVRLRAVLRSVAYLLKRCEQSEISVLLSKLFPYLNICSRLSYILVNIFRTCLFQ